MENIAFEIFADGIYEKGTSDLIIKKIPHNGVMLDIGANIGSITMPVCKVRPDVKVICIEASHNVFNYLEKNISANKFENCVLVNSAISEADNQQVVFSTRMICLGKDQWHLPLPVQVRRLKL